jgi:hypothetical protein
MDKDWRKIQSEGLGPVSRIAAVFQVGPPLATLPFAKFKVKIIENESGRFLGVANVAIKASDGSPNWIAGLGGTIEEALADTLRYFKDSLEGRSGLSNDAFEWAAWADF